MTKIIIGILRFFRSILKAFLVLLPVAIVGTIYTNRDYMNPDGILLWWEYLTRDEVPEVTLPTDWGHDTIPPPNPHILEVASLLRAGDYAGLEALSKRDPDAFNYFRDTTPDLADALDAWVGAQPRSALALIRPSAVPRPTILRQSPSIQRLRRPTGG